ncbi:zinc-binding dehydrogenase [Streptomyces sp. NPDC058877]|uniref:zinc-binding dehydrogenase n=1 Tax=Streptomyces sp. NPDC058877 TaxID=3346665 RepID=UPI0036B6D191
MADRPAARRRRHRNARSSPHRRHGVAFPRDGFRYPLAQAARAHADLESRRHRGKAVLLP